MPDPEFKASLVVTRDEPATCTLDITRAPFNTPAKVKGVRIELWELDKSQDTKGKETSRDDLLGTFTVDLTPKRAQGGKRKIEIQFKNFEEPIREPDTVMGILLVNVGQHQQRVKVGMDFGEWPEKKY
ncbi:MAG: hypothetical protein ACFFES_17820, partial [Candidatus Thorarchaeota archaeon]